MSRTEIYRRRNMSAFWIYLGLFSAISIIVTSLLLLLYPFPSDEKVPFFEREHPIIFQEQIYKQEAIVKDETVYLPFEFVKEHIDSEIMYSEETESFIINTSNELLQYSNESLKDFVNGVPFELEIQALLHKDNTPYLSLEPLASIYPMDTSYSSETGAVFVHRDGDLLLTGTIMNELDEHDARMRVSPSLTSPYVAEVAPDEKIYIEFEESQFYFVRKENGTAGFLRKETVQLREPIEIEVEYVRESRGYPDIQWPINLTWEAVYSKNPDTNKLPTMPGLNIVSPTWFSIKNDEGEIRSLASLDYVKWANDRGYDVWALFSNDFDPKRTHNVLSDVETRKKMIRQLLQYSEMYELDGINIDFENVNLEDSKLVTQFVKELTSYLHQAGLVVSMDITFISGSENWSMFYEREKLATIVDYLMVMAYDEHWGTSPKSGSVASLPWVENNMNRLLEIIPNERLILGVPYYSRIWKEQETDGGNIEVSSKAYSMNAIQDWITERNLTPQLDDSTGQNYVEYRDEEGKATYKIWLEDEHSLQQRAKLVHKYKLAGVASWSRFFANDEAWKVVDESLSQYEPVKNEDLN